MKLKLWSEHSPDNYLHQYLLVKAEMESINKINKKATHLYRQAIQLAEENGFLHDTAIANECAAHYYLADGLPKSAQAYMIDAYLFYQKWGAYHIADRLLNKHSELIIQNVGDQTVSVAENDSFDMHAVFQVATVLSSEVNFDQLVMKVMNTLLTYGGAEKVYLLLNNKDKLQIVADHDVYGDIHVYQEYRDIDQYQHFPITVINYVTTTHETLVLSHASKLGDFVRDSYIFENHVKSVLCLPILIQQKLMGILYLENNQTSDAFTRDIIDLLNLLYTQLVILFMITYS